MLNARIIKDYTIVIYQDNILESLVRVTVYNKIDLISMYYQILMAKGNIHKTAFKILFNEATYHNLWPKPSFTP